MEINIKDTDTLGSGAYILNANGSGTAPVLHPVRIFLTQENNRSLKYEILKLIQESKEVLKICSFIIADEEIFIAIRNKAQNSNTAIFILTQLDQKKLTDQSALFNYLTEEEISQNSTQSHLRKIKKLYENGVHIRASASVHAKFIIADRTRALITSANLTTLSLNLNTESGVYLNEKSATELDLLFDLIFKSGTYKQFIDSTKKNEVMIVQSFEEMNIERLPDPAASNLRYTYETDANNLYDEMVAIINEASHYLYLSTYSIVKLSSLTALMQALKDARSRGVEINIFCRGMNFRNDHLEGSHMLSALGCNLFGDISNHSKGIVSEKAGMLFTANIDGEHGLTNGMEVGYLLSENERVEFLNIHEIMIDAAFYTFQPKPSRRTFFETYENYESLKEISALEGFPEITIEVKPGLQINETELKDCPLFYGKGKNEHYLIAGKSFYLCDKVNNTYSLIKKEYPDYQPEKMLLKYVNLKIILN